MPLINQLQLDIVEEKPPFRIPTMAEIDELEPNGLKVVSFFSGCGGSCLGFRMAGFTTLYASEFVPAAADTYRANHGGVPLDTRDIREVDPAEVLEAVGLFPGEVDVVEGSPPCASFSMAGKRDNGEWGKVRKYSDVKQRTDDLFDEYVRMIAGIRPRAFVAENVTGLIAGEAPTAYIQSITRTLGRLGYALESQILDAARFGVPQRRKRLILIGVRRDVGRPSWPSPLPYTYSVRDALPDLEAVQSLYGFDGHAFYSASRPAETIPQAPGGTMLVEVRRLYSGRELVDDNVAPSLEPFAIGEEWDNLEADGRGSERYFSLYRPDPEKPLPTVTQVGGSPNVAAVVHPTEKRKFSMRELKALCGFPADFVLTGSYYQQWERLGRAVPPPMMAAIARALRNDVLLSG